MAFLMSLRKFLRSTAVVNFCPKVVGDHIPGEGVGFAIVFSGAVVKLGGEQRRLSFSFPDDCCVWALLGGLEDPVDDHRVRVRLPVGKHRALPFPQ